jgi:hypothetical protein
MTNYDIEKAIEDLFTKTESPFQFKKVDVQKGIPTLTRTGMSVAVVSGNYEKPELDGMLEETVKIIVLMVFENVASEEFRRQSAHSAVQYVVSKLQGQTLGLDIKPIEATGWSEVTTPESLGRALLIVEANFTTAIEIIPDIEKCDYRELESIWSSYEMDGDTVLESHVNFNDEGKKGNG